jgi:hypothetical protein
MKNFLRAKNGPAFLLYSSGGIEDCFIEGEANPRCFYAVVNRVGWDENEALPKAVSRGGA